ncbi:putative transmembrane protein ZNF593OS [Chaetodon trifascialis]|uniref:putative transmembrane protein ZNF593OS n=1 Tax=Chaetodon trifascialis TaxID=109706 RepID=UPI003992ED10
MKEGCWLVREAPAAEMIIRLGRLTPGYFRLLQRQVSGEVRVQPQSSLIEPVAMTMATVGMGVSLYSAKQMAERVHLKLPNA